MSALLPPGPRDVAALDTGPGEEDDAQQGGGGETGCDKIEPRNEHIISFRRKVNQPGPLSLSSPAFTILPGRRVEVGCADISLL